MTISLDELRQKMAILQACVEAVESTNCVRLYDDQQDVTIELSDLKPVIAAANVLPELVVKLRKISNQPHGNCDFGNCSACIADSALTLAEKVNL